MRSAQIARRHAAMGRGFLYSALHTTPYALGTEQAELKTSGRHPAGDWASFSTLCTSYDAMLTQAAESLMRQSVIDHTIHDHRLLCHPFL